MLAAMTATTPASVDFGKVLAAVDLPLIMGMFVWDPVAGWIAGVVDSEGPQSGGLVVFNAPSGSERFRILDGDSHPLGLAASPDGSKLAWTYVGGSMGSAGGIRVINTQSGSDVWRRNPAGLSPMFSLDGDAIVVRRTTGGNIAVYDSAQGAVNWDRDLKATKAIFSPDSRLLLCNGIAQSTIARAEDGQATAQVPISAAAFTPDSGQVVGLVWDPTPTVQRFNTSDGAAGQFTTLAAPGALQSGTRRFVLSDDTRLIAAGDATSLGVFATATGQLRFPPNTTLGAPTAMAFSHDGACIAVISKAGTLLTVLDCASGAVLFGQSLSAHPSSKVAFSPSGDSFLVSGSALLRIFSTGHPAATVRSEFDFDSPVTSVAVANTPAPRGIAVAEQVTVFDASTGQLVRNRSVAGVISAMLISPTNDYVVVASSDKILRSFDVNGEDRWRATHTAGITAAAISPRSGALIATGAGVGDKNVRVFARDLAAGEAPDSHRPQWAQPQPNAITHIAVSGDDKLVAASLTDRSTHLFNASNGDTVATFTHDDQIHHVVFSPAGAVLAIAIKDGTVALIDTSTLTKTRDLVHPTAVIAVSFSPDGTLLATATADPDATVRVWQLSPVATEPIYTYHQAAKINAIAFSPTTARLTIAPDAQPAFIVDPLTGKEDRRLPNTNADSVAYSSDGTLLIAGAGATARVFATA
jgi:WD40 repeat protein